MNNIEDIPVSSLQQVLKRKKNQIRRDMSSDILHSDDDENISGEEDEDYKLWKQEQIRLDEQFEQTAAELEVISSSSFVAN